MNIYLKLMLGRLVG